MLLAQVPRNHDLPLRRHCRGGHKPSYRIGKTGFRSVLLGQSPPMLMAVCRRVSCVSQRGPGAEVSFDALSLSGG
jgi:hypothetical protein